MSQLFWMSINFAILGGFVMRKPRKSWNFWKIGPKRPYFYTSNPLKWVPFLAKITGFEAWAAHPCPTQIWVPPPRDYKSNWFLLLLCIYTLFGQAIRWCKLFWIRQSNNFAPTNQIFPFTHGWTWWACHIPTICSVIISENNGTASLIL